MKIDIFQVQRLLKSIGHDPGAIDGVWGAKSQAALDSALNANEKSSFDELVEATLPAETHTFWDEIHHFTRNEFKCKCGKYCNGFPVEPDERIVRLAEKVRNHFNAPAIISSGIRCETHNRNVGGVAGSRHRLGKAVDIYVRGVTAASLDAYIGSLTEVRYHYKIDGAYCHMDVV